MKTWSMVAFVCLGLVVLGACGGDDDTSACDEAFDKWCACPDVSCDGHPESCTGPDKEWAECVLAAEDICTAECT
jgi:hypothetical protein